MRRILMAITTLMMLAACTPQEMAFWASYHQEHPAEVESLLPGIDLSSPAIADRPASRVQSPTTEPESHCYDTPGGTLCAVDGTAEAALYADLQRLLYDGVGVSDPGPGQLAPGYEVAPTEPAELAPSVRCFILVGGTFCYEEGTADYERAVVLEAEYLSIDHNLIPAEPID